MKKGLKKLLSGVIAALVLISACPLSELNIKAQAGTLNYLAYSINDDSEAVITKCSTDATGEIIIPSEIEGYPVTTIQNYAFHNCVNITNIIITDTLTTIGPGAFYGSGLTSIDIPANVTEIPNSAFNYCESLSSIKLHEGIINIGSFAFGNCHSLTEIVLPESLLTIGLGAFFECKELKSINLPTKLTDIGSEAFNGCVKLSSDIVIPDGVTVINANMFRNCNLLNSMLLHDNITTINSTAFLNCNELPPIKLPKNLVTIGSYAFYFNDVQLPLPEKIETIGAFAFCSAEFFDENGEELTELDIPENVKAIGKEAFAGTVDIKNVNIPAGVESIGENAFNYPQFNVDELNNYYFSDNYGVLYNKYVTNIIRAPYYTDEVEYIIPETVTTIDANAFGVSAFTKIYIPSSLTNIADLSFQRCIETSFEVSKDNPNYVSDENGALYTKNYTTLIKFPQNEEKTIIELPDNVETIDKYAFYGNDSIVSLKMGDNVTEIKDYALAQCDNLKEIHFSNNLKTIGAYVFYGTGQNAFTQITIPDSVTSMGMYAFSATRIQTFVIPLGVTVLESSLFSSCSKLESVVISDRVTEIKSYAFHRCSTLKDVYYCGSSEDWEAIKISENGNSALQSATIHYNYGKESGTCGEALSWTFDDATGELEIYGIGKMEDYTNLKTAPWKDYRSLILSVKINDSVESIGEYAFYHCNNLTNVTIGKSVTNIGLRAFIGCTNLESITIPNSVTSIGIYAFSDCNNLKNITVSDDNNVYSSDEYGVLFDKDKTELIQYPVGNTRTTYSVPDSVININAYAFSDCPNLTNVSIPEGVITISGSAFRSCTGLNSIMIPDSVTSIGSQAFAICDSLTNITVDESNPVYSSDESGVLFDKNKTNLIQYPANSSITNYSIPGEVTRISTYAFYNSANLAKLTIPDSVTTIEASAFVHCTGLESVIIPDSVTSIDAFAFEGCTNLKSITVPGSVAIIEGGVFRYCENLTNLIIEDGVKGIDSSAFFDCYTLDSVTIPDTVTYISYDAFGGCKNITDVYYQGDKNQWESITIYDGNSVLQSATTHYNYGKESGTCGENATYSYDADSKTLTISGEGDMFSFEDASEFDWSCYKDEVKYITVNSKVTSVGDNAFKDFTSLKEVVLGNNVINVGENAFNGCTKLSLVSSTANSLSFADSSFVDCNERLTIICNSGNENALNFAEANSIKSVPVSFEQENNVLKFNSELTVYSDLDYNFLSKFLNNYRNTEYLFFKKLVFDGIQPDTVNVEDLENESSAQFLTFNNLYVSIKAVKDNVYEDVTFAELLTLLEEGDYDAFMFELNSDESNQILTFEENWKRVVNDFMEDVLRVTSKVINFFRRLFKR